MSTHIALVGDSIFDNKAYTGGEPDVVEHLRDLLPSGWCASLGAVDGSVNDDLAVQLERVPRDASRLVISIGGNDVLHNGDLLDTPVGSSADALALFGERLTLFETAYCSAVDNALSLGKETTICTIYNGNFAADEAPIVRVALTTFNDVILRAAFQRRLTVIDLRLVCTESSDYANAIEPSGRGGRKIAEAIARSCGAMECPALSRVYAG
jgi:hypothetical protein